MSLGFLFHYFMLNMFRMLVHLSSGACDIFVELFHWLCCSAEACIRIPHHHTVTPTHIEPEQYNTWNKSTISRKLVKMDVLTFETCWAVNSEKIKQVTSSWSIFIQLFVAYCNSASWTLFQFSYPVGYYGYERLEVVSAVLLKHSSVLRCRALSLCIFPDVSKVPSAFTHFLGVECDSTLAIWNVRKCQTNDRALHSRILESSNKVWILLTHLYCRIYSDRKACFLLQGHPFYFSSNFKLY